MIVYIDYYFTLFYGFMLYINYCLTRVVMKLCTDARSLNKDLIYKIFSDKFTMEGRMAGGMSPTLMMNLYLHKYKIID